MTPRALIVVALAAAAAVALLVPFARDPTWLEPVTSGSSAASAAVETWITDCSLRQTANPTGCPQRAVVRSPGDIRWTARQPLMAWISSSWNPTTGTYDVRGVYRFGYHFTAADPSLPSLEGDYQGYVEVRLRPTSDGRDFGSQAFDARAATLPGFIYQYYADGTLRCCG